MLLISRLAAYPITRPTKGIIVSAKEKRRADTNHEGNCIPVV
jgi:hypothetical protein